ncbi:MAG: hypothetical protein WDZ69_00940 [Candidatus Pacearchaeota archaeon]
MEGINTREEYTNLFKGYIDETPEFGEWVDIARIHSKGNIWVMGGLVYRNIIERLYEKLPEKIVDADFLVENYAREVIRPKGWEQVLNRRGILTFKKADESAQITISSLQNFHSIERRGLPPHIRHFYTGNPLNIQSIIYDCGEGDFRKGSVYGRRGIDAIKTRRIKVNNIDEAKYEAKYKRVSLEKLIKDKAEELPGFDYVLP